MRIALFLPNWVGDTVMATPALRALRNTYPHARLVGVLRPSIAGVLQGLGWLDAVVYLDPRGPSDQRWRAAAAALRRERVDMAVLFPSSFHSAWTAWLGRCRQRIGYARYGRSPLLTDVVPAPNGWTVPSPVIDAYNRLAQRAGARDPGYRMELATTRADEEAADAVWRECALAGREVVCLNPGAAFGSAKHWPVESFGALARLLADGGGCHVLVLCGPGEEDMARRIVRGAGRPDVYTLAGRRLSLGLTKACVRRTDLLVTTDSGPRHFAAAFDRPVVTLFGPTHVAWTETYHAKAVHLQKKVDCGPCQRRVCPLDHRCMTTLTPAEVFAAADQLLKRFARRAG